MAKRYTDSSITCAACRAVGPLVERKVDCEVDETSFEDAINEINVALSGIGYLDIDNLTGLIEFRNEGE